MFRYNQLVGIELLTQRVNTLYIFMTVSKSAESGLVPDLKETLADMQPLPDFQTTRHMHTHIKVLSPQTQTLMHMFTHIQNPSDSVTHTHTHGACKGK